MKEDPEETIRSTRGDENGASPKLTCDDVGTSVGICVALLGLSAGVVMYVVYVRALLQLANAVALVLWLHFSPL